MSVYKKLQEARVKLQKVNLKKTGENKFSKYNYFELGDFLPTIQEIFAELGLCGVISFSADSACLTIVDTDKADDRIVFSTPSAEVELKGCLPIQGIGAAQTYLRRYLWVTAMEIVENDAIDATTGDTSKPTQSVETKPEVKKAPVPASKTVQAKGELIVVDVMKKLVDAVAANDWNGVAESYFNSGLEKADKESLFKGLQPNVKKFLIDEGKKRANG